MAELEHVKPIIQRLLPGILQIPVDEESLTYQITGKFMAVIEVDTQTLERSGQLRLPGVN